jgi:hypothetical protein
VNIGAIEPWMEISTEKGDNTVFSMADRVFLAPGDRRL